MRITNNTSFKVIAYIFHYNYGKGALVEIFPQQTAEVEGPLIGRLNDGDCYVYLPGKVTCHEGGDTANNHLHLSRGNSITTENEGSGQGVRIRHYLDKAI